MPDLMANMRKDYDVKRITLAKAPDRNAALATLETIVEKEKTFYREEIAKIASLRSWGDLRRMRQAGKDLSEEDKRHNNASRRFIAWKKEFSEDNYSNLPRLKSQFNLIKQNAVDLGFITEEEYQPRERALNRDIEAIAKTIHLSLEDVRILTEPDSFLAVEWAAGISNTPSSMIFSENHAYLNEADYFSRAADLIGKMATILADPVIAQNINKPTELEPAAKRVQRALDKVFAPEFRQVFPDIILDEGFVPKIQPTLLTDCFITDTHKKLNKLNRAQPNQIQSLPEKPIHDSDGATRPPAASEAGAKVPSFIGNALKRVIRKRVEAALELPPKPAQMQPQPAPDNVPLLEVPHPLDGVDVLGKHTEQVHAERKEAEGPDNEKPTATRYS